jgi:DNA-binding transcriptional LysR family regulator
MDRLAAMRTFLRVIDTGSFSMAARQLRVGQPAVSKSVAQLEAELGIRLLARSTRGLSATDAGLRFYERARRAVEEADEAEIAARDANAGLTGRLRVSTAVTFGRMHIVPYLAPFMAAHPGLEIELIMDDQQTDLVEEGVDIALRLGPQRDSTLSGKVIASRPRRVLATPDYFALHGVPQHPSELPGYPAIGLMLAGGRDSAVFSRGDERLEIELRSMLRLTAAEGALAAVLAGLGLFVGTEWAFGDALAARTVLAVLSDWTLPTADVWAVLPAGRQPAARARAFVGFAEAVLNAPSPRRPLPEQGSFHVRAA